MAFCDGKSEEKHRELRVMRVLRVRSFQTHFAHLSRQDDGQLQNGAPTATEWPQCQMISSPAR